MNMYCWHIVNKHGSSAFIANDFLIRNSPTFKVSGAQYTTQILLLFFCKWTWTHVTDQYLSGILVSSVVSSFLLSHSCLFPLENPSHAFGIPIISTPVALNFQFKDPRPLPWVPEVILALFPTEYRSCLYWRPAQKTSGAEHDFFDGAEPMTSQFKSV